MPPDLTGDTSFDADGKVKLDFGDGDQGFGVELDSSGKVVVGGITNTITDTEGDLLVVRLNANGSLDTGFNADGSRIIDLGGTKQGIVLREKKGSATYNARIG